MMLERLPNRLSLFYQRGLTINTGQPCLWLQPQPIFLTSIPPTVNLRTRCNFRPLQTELP
jgi:hypothetical protein